MDSKPSQKGNKEELSVEVPKRLVSQSETVSPSNLQFDRQQPPEEAFTKESRIDFGQFTTREAVLDEEFWVSYKFTITISSMKAKILTMIFSTKINK